MASTMAQAPLCVDTTFQVPFTHREIDGFDFMPDGRILVAGGMSQGPPAVTGLSRLLPDGTIDPTFGPNYILRSADVRVRNGEFYFASIGATGVRRFFIVDGTIDYSYGLVYPEFSTSHGQATGRVR